MSWPGRDVRAFALSHLVTAISVSPRDEEGPAGLGSAGLGH